MNKRSNIYHQDFIEIQSYGKIKKEKKTITTCVLCQKRKELQQSKSVIYTKIGQQHLMIPIRFKICKKCKEKYKIGEKK